MKSPASYRAARRNLARELVSLPRPDGVARPNWRTAWTLLSAPAPFHYRPARFSGKACDTKGKR